MNYVQTLRQAIAEELPGLPEELLDMYTLIGLLFGKFTGNAEIHDAWSVWQNKTNPEHRSLIPFDKLTYEVQDLDSKYRDGVIAAVRKVRRATK